MNKNEIYIKDMQIRSSKDERVSYNIHDMINSTEKEYSKHLLLCHAFTSCNTTSQIDNFGKKLIFSKFKMSKDLHLSKQFYQNTTTFNEVENANIRVFGLLHVTNIEVGPPEWLRIVRCGCKGPCVAKCSCRKAGL